MRSITINGEVFSVPRKSIDYITAIRMLDRYAGRVLSDCYARPSETKTAIFDRWLNWSVNCDVRYFGVCSYNTNIFTLQGMYHDPESEIMYFIHITPTRQTATIIDV